MDIFSAAIHAQSIIQENTGLFIPIANIYFSAHDNMGTVSACVEQVNGTIHCAVDASLQQNDVEQITVLIHELCHVAIGWEDGEYVRNHHGASYRKIALRAGLCGKCCGEATIALKMQIMKRLGTLKPRSRVQAA